MSIDCYQSVTEAEQYWRQNVEAAVNSLSPSADNTAILEGLWAFNPSCEKELVMDYTEQYYAMYMALLSAVSLHAGLPEAYTLGAIERVVRVQQKYGFEGFNVCNLSEAICSLQRFVAKCFEVDTGYFADAKRAAGEI